MEKQNIIKKFIISKDKSEKNVMTVYYKGLNQKVTSEVSKDRIDNVINIMNEQFKEEKNYLPITHLTGASLGISLGIMMGGMVTVFGLVATEAIPENYSYIGMGASILPMAGWTLKQLPRCFKLMRQKPYDQFMDMTKNGDKILLEELGEIKSANIKKIVSLNEYTDSVDVNIAKQLKPNQLKKVLDYHNKTKELA